MADTEPQGNSAAVVQWDTPDDSIPMKDIISGIGSADLNSIMREVKNPYSLLLDAPAGGDMDGSEVVESSYQACEPDESSPRAGGSAAESCSDSEQQQQVRRSVRQQERDDRMRAEQIMRENKEEEERWRKERNAAVAAQEQNHQPADERERSRETSSIMKGSTDERSSSGSSSSGEGIYQTEPMLVLHDVTKTHPVEAGSATSGGSGKPAAATTSPTSSTTLPTSPRHWQ